MKNLLVTIILCCALYSHAQMQTLSGASTRWSDSFVAWEIFIFNPDTLEADAPFELKFGDLQLRRLGVREDWSEWEYEYGDGERGNIKRRWKDDPSQWELRSYNGDIITMRTAWANDFTEWRVTDNATTLIFKSRWTNQFDEWQLKDDAHGQFYLKTLRRNDPRDWAIDDQLDADISLPMKLAFTFLALYHASPRL